MASFRVVPGALVPPSLIVGLSPPCGEGAPGAFEIGARLVEAGRRASAMLPRVAPGVKAALPSPFLCRVRRADGARDSADMHVAGIDQPAVGAVRIGAAGEVRHRRIKSSSKPARKLSIPWGSERR